MFVLFFLMVITSHGLINIKFETLNDSLAQLNLLLRLKISNSNNDDERVVLAANAELIAALLKTKKLVASFLGIPVTPRMLTAIFAELGFACVIIFQFFIASFNDAFTVGILPRVKN